MDHVTCRACGSAELAVVLDLGDQPLANSLLDSPPISACAERTWPLRLAICRSCTLLQLTDIVPPQELFTDYVYFSSYSTQMLAHAEAAARQHIADFALDGRSFVVEIASNDGYLLQNFLSHDIPSIGVEPARNVAAVARAKGIRTLEEFFDENVAKDIARQHGRASLVLGNNVFAHVPQPNDFVAGIAALLAERGVAALEFPWAVEMVRKIEFDTIYHEHVFYFNVTPLLPLFSQHGLQIFRVEKLPIHGGSLRVYVCPQGTRPVETSVAELLDEEQAFGVRSAETYDTFRKRVHELRNDLRLLLQTLKAQGHSIAAYGASAKGSTLLNFCDINRTIIDFIVDRSPHKQSRLSPGKHIPVCAPEKLLQALPDYTLLLTWNFADEIQQQQQEYRNRGGRFILPVPYPQVLP